MTPDPFPSAEIKEYQVKIVKQLFGENMQVTFEIVDAIRKERSGKYQFTKCLLHGENIPS